MFTIKTCKRLINENNDISNGISWINHVKLKLINEYTRIK